MVTTPAVEQKELIRYRVEDGVAILEMDDPQADRLAETMSAIFLDGVTNGLVTPRPRPVALDRHAVQEATRAVG